MTDGDRPPAGDASGAGALDAEAACVVGLSAALGRGEAGRTEEALAEASRRVEAGEARAEAVEEAILQAHLFLGYPASLAALERWRALGHPPPEEGAGGAEGRRERGESVCRAVYGDTYGRLREKVARLHPDMDRWMVEEGYGRVLGRPGLDLRVRELCVVALLAGTRFEPQLHSHLRGALNVGVPPADVEAALRVAAGGEDPERALPDAWSLWLRIRPPAAAG